MWVEEYFGPRYFSKKFFGPKESTSVTIRQVTYWSPQHFSTKHFAGRYFGQGFRVLIDLVELEAEDSAITVDDVAVLSGTEFRTIVASDTADITLLEVVPVFTGQGFTLFDSADLDLDESTTMVKDWELDDTVSLTLVEVAVLGQQESRIAADVWVIVVQETAELVKLPFYRDVDSILPDDFYTDWTDE